LEPPSKSYYEWMKVGSRRSATAVVPFLMELLDPRSVLDVGCGTGSWLKVFQEHGVEDVLGLDGDWVDRSLLEIGTDQYRAADLEDDLRVERRFDLALCLEVAHYLPEESGARLIERLTAVAPAVLFSAAIPGQGGHGVNPQWPDYWVERFEGSAYVCIDCVRPRIWDEPGVAVWYAQNALLFADHTLVEQRPALAGELERASGRPLSIVHPGIHRANRERLAEAQRQAATDAL
jgi:SAM-dependent methyltransferase